MLSGGRYQGDEELIRRADDIATTIFARDHSIRGVDSASRLSDVDARITSAVPVPENDTHRPR